jgi:arylsulfatase A-like enzyme
MRDGRNPAGSWWRMGLGRRLLTGLTVALLGSTAIALVEIAVTVAICSRRWDESVWPWPSIIAAFGKFALSHVLVWGSVLVVAAAVHWAIRRRCAPDEAYPALAAIGVLAAGAVVVPADAELAGSALGTTFLGRVVTVAIVAGVALVTYALLRLAGRRLRFTRLGKAFRLGACVCAVVLIFATLVLVCSPLAGPARYRVPDGQPFAGSPEHPHVLWIVLDTVRPDRMSGYGHSRQTTPFLEQWERHAVTFDHAVANGMWTVPSHASMFTGLSVREHGVDHANLRLADDVATVADVLAANGYATASFSNNPWISRETNLAKGFGDCRLLYHLRRMQRFSLDQVCENWGFVPRLPWLDGDYGAAMTNQLIGRWLDARADDGRPVFVFVNYMEAHLPYSVPRAYRERFMTPEQVRRSYALRKRAYGSIVSVMDLRFNIDGSEFMPASDREVLRRQYEAAVCYLDERVRELIGMFAQRGMLDDTLVVITSDHGEYLGTHGLWSHRFMTYDDVARVALLLREPHRQEGARIATPVQLSELYPTVLETALGPEAGVPVRRGQRNLLEVAANGGPVRLAVTEYSGPSSSTLERAKRSGRPAALHAVEPQIAVQGDRYKLIVSNDGLRELFDLHEDPAELDNCIDREADEAKRLAAAAESWLGATAAHETAPDASQPAMQDPMIDALKRLGYLND